ncbi:MAG: hypothetical protein GWO02_03575, partial [Gammaproteobacteria bacterium]|nr:hypothetical protein [Gammaproteobacteria bacterium]
TRLRAELAIARQTIETTRQSRSTQSASEAEEQQRKLAQAAAEEASSLRAALAGAEQKITALDNELQAARGATSDARAETRRLEAALQEAKEQTDVEVRDLALAATASSAKV